MVMESPTNSMSRDWGCAGRMPSWESTVICLMAMVDMAHSDSFTIRTVTSCAASLWNTV